VGNEDERSKIAHIATTPVGCGVLQIIVVVIRPSIVRPGWPLRGLSGQENAAEAGLARICEGMSRATTVATKIASRSVPASQEIRASYRLLPRRAYVKAILIPST
jgi:hypothetical protein